MNAEERIHKMNVMIDGLVNYADYLSHLYRNEKDEYSTLKSEHEDVQDELKEAKEQSERDTQAAKRVIAAMDKKNKECLDLKAEIEKLKEDKKRLIEKVDDPLHYQSLKTRITEAFADFISAPARTKEDFIVRIYGFDDWGLSQDETDLLKAKLYGD